MNSLRLKIVLQEIYKEGVLIDGVASILISNTNVGEVKKLELTKKIENCFSRK